jgi:leader peptidase (prepilin peptidase)/N-methyltransferase
MNRALSVLIGVIIGLAVGWATNEFSKKLAASEHLIWDNQFVYRLGFLILDGVSFGVLSYVYGLNSLFVIRALWTSILVQIFFYDLQYKLISDKVIIPSYLAAILISIFTPNLGLLNAILSGLGAGLAFLLIFLIGRAIWRREAIGFGDVKLAVFIGLICGMGSSFATITALFIGVMLGGIVGVLLIVLKVVSLSDMIPYGPFLALGAIAELIMLGMH